MTTFDAFEQYDALGLAELVREGQVTPRELVEASLERIDERNPALNAVVHRMDDEALATADATREGPFAGVPLLVKDILAEVKGQPLTEASRFLRGYVSPHDTELVQRFRRAGFVFVGKTNAPELGIMGVTESRLHGPARNPWDQAHTPGGSSGGAAAATAAGMVPLAHANDGGGSIRIPASCCGLFGLKPSRGRVPLGPDVGEHWGGLTQELAVTRSVRDAAALLDAVAGLDVGAPYGAPAPERPFLEEVGREPGRLRVAYTTGSLFGNDTHVDCKAAVEDAARLCERLGHRVEEVHPPYEKERLREAYLRVVAVSVVQDVERYGEALGRTPRAEDFEDETWLLYLIGRKTNAPTYADAVRAMHQAGRRMGRFMEEHDVVLTATLAAPPARIGDWSASPPERVLMRGLRAVPVKQALDLALSQMAGDKLQGTANTMLFNQTGQPAMSVPLHWNGAGLPIGVQFAARYGEEATLLRLAAQLEVERPWFERRPPGYP